MSVVCTCVHMCVVCMCVCACLCICVCGVHACGLCVVCGFYVPHSCHTDLHKELT